MLEQDMYVREKLREIESGRILSAQVVAQPHGKPALAPLARPLGRALHRIGHRMEVWATPPEQEMRDLTLRGRAR